MSNEVPHLFLIDARADFELELEIALRWDLTKIIAKEEGKTILQTFEELANDYRKSFQKFHLGSQR